MTKFDCYTVPYFDLLNPTFERSLVVSVLPVPAGPAGAPPRTICRAPISVR